MDNLSLKITPFPQTPNPENDNQREELSNSLSSTTTRACARTRARDEVDQYFCDTFGTATVPPVAVRQIDYALERGMAPELVMTALDEAAVAPRPSWAYARAIIQRLLGEGVLTPDAYAQRQARWYSRRSRDHELPF